MHKVRIFIEILLMMPPRRKTIISLVFNMVDGTL